jgi:hypothetical protein
MPAVPPLFRAESVQAARMMSSSASLFPALIPEDKSRYFGSHLHAQSNAVEVGVEKKLA